MVVDGARVLSTIEVPRATSGQYSTGALAPRVV